MTTVNEEERNVASGKNLQEKNQNPTISREPYVVITEQPQSHGLVFKKYKDILPCQDAESSDFSYDIRGESWNELKKSYPTIKVCNYEGPVIVVVSCVTKDDIPFCKPHPNELVGPGCSKGVFTRKFKQGDLLQFPGIGITRTTLYEIVSSLRLREDIKVDPFQTGYDYDKEHVDLDVVRLCFQVFLPNGTRNLPRIVPPVVSNPIYNFYSCLAPFHPTSISALVNIPPLPELLRCPTEQTNNTIRNFSQYLGVSLDELSSIPYSPFLHRVNETEQHAVPQSSNKEANNATITGVAGGSVSNSNACGIQIVEGNVAINTQVKEDLSGVSCRVEQGDESSVPHVKFSVPAKDGDSKVLVACQDGEVKKWLYLHDDGTPEKSHTKWTFRNVLHGLMGAILGESAESFSQFVDVLKSVYGCKLSKAYNHCLVLEFLHDNDEDAERMMGDRDNVKKLFTKFLRDIGKDGTDEVEVSCEKIDMRRTKSDHYGSIPSTSREENILPSSHQSSHRVKKEAFSGIMHSSEWKRRVKREMHLVTKDPYEEDPPFKKKKSMEEEEGKCDKCDAVLQQYRKLGKGDIYIIHLPTFVIYDQEMMNIQTQEKADGCLKILSALRNANGGTLLLHLDSQRDSKLNDRIMSFIHTMCKKVIVPGEVSCDVFEVERDSQNDSVYILHAERSDSIITVDFKTKMPGPTKYWDEISADELRSFLSGKRKVADKKPQLIGLAQGSQAINIVKLEYEQPDTPQTEQELADIMVNDLFLAEHVTACSKRKQAGSVFVGQPFHVKTESPVHGWDITGFDFETGFEEKFRLVLRQTLESHILVYNNKHSAKKLQAKDIFEIGLHKLNEGFIVEVAVRALNGCVFYDPKGPEAYKIDKGVIQSIPFDIWIENFVHS